MNKILLKLLDCHAVKQQLAMMPFRLFYLIVISCVFFLFDAPIQANTGHSHVQTAQTNISPSSKENTPLSLNFQDIPVRDLLALLAQFQGMNLVLNDNVQGNLTLHLENVTLQEALDTVLNMQGLSMRQEGKIWLIAPAAQMAANETEQLAGQEVHHELIPIQYAKATEINALLQSKNNGLLSDRGSVVVDERTNQLWVKDTSEHLTQIRTFLKSVDVPAKQIQIAARIVNADVTSVEELGVKFGTSSDEESASGPLHMDMPLKIDVGHFSVAIAKLGEGRLLDLELSALEKEGRVHIVSNPQLMTANRQAASIESGQEVPYQEKTASGATSTSFKKAVLSLKVTPEITPENKIMLTLLVNQDKVDALTVNGVPAISTQQVQSQVLLNNGETIVLGGIYEQSNNNVVERVPFWSSIPILGYLFSNKQTHSEQKELLIFITPKVIEA